MSKYSIGIDVGGTKVLTAIVDKTNGEVMSFIKKKTKHEQGIDKITEKIIDSVYEVLKSSQISLDKIDSIGIGVAGQTDRENGIIINAPNINCSDLNIKQILENEFKKNVVVGNDVEIATIGEMYFGSGKDESDFICIFVGTGIGSGIVSDGKIRYGVSGTAGEIGHIIVERGGRICGCGACGCLEAYASRLAIEKRIIGSLKKGRKSDIVNYMKDEKPIKTKMIKQSLDNNDELVTQIVEEAADYLASGLASIINFYNPGLIILGGGLINAIDSYYEKAVTLAGIKSLPVPGGRTKFKKAKLGDYSGVVGAALLEDYRKIH